MAVSESAYQPERPAQTTRGALGHDGVPVGEVAALWGRRLRGAPGKHRRAHSLRRQPRSITGPSGVATLQGRDP